MTTIFKEQKYLCSQQKYRGCHSVAYTVPVFPPKGGNMALPRPLILKFILKNTDLQY